MIKGIGCDIIDNERISRLLSRFGERFIKRILSPDEQINAQKKAKPALYISKRFAAKEALVKALGTGFSQGIGFQSIAILNAPSGAPVVQLTGCAKAKAQSLGLSNIHISLSDEQSHSIALVVLEG